MRFMQLSRKNVEHYQTPWVSADPEPVAHYGVLPGPEAGTVVAWAKEFGAEPTEQQPLLLHSVIKGPWGLEVEVPGLVLL